MASLILIVSNHFDKVIGLFDFPKQHCFGFNLSKNKYKVKKSVLGSWVPNFYKQA